MAPSSGEETWPVSATLACACSAGGGANANPTVKIAVVASHLPCMRISVSPWERFRLGSGSRFFQILAIQAFGAFGTRVQDIRFARGVQGFFGCRYNVVMAVLTNHFRPRC